MRIAIHAADLDHKRIDGTRVYLLNVLKNLGKFQSQDFFTIYHQNDFNPHLEPPKFSNYEIKKLPWPLLWTQLRFAWQLFWDKPDVLWMPVHNVPLVRRRKMKVVITIHDLAFKIFPKYFPANDLRKLNRLTDLAVRNADGIIAVSEATKNDILKFYPEISKEKIKVIHHGFDGEIYAKNVSEIESTKILKKYDLKNKQYLLYVGAIQPRKDLITLVKAFEKTKKYFPDLKLMIAGAPAWHANKTLECIEKSAHKKDIIISGTIDFEQLNVLYQNAAIFVFPSLYEGFGIPVLEAMAKRVPTILAKNSSLLEIGGEAALYFETGNFQELSEKIVEVLQNEDLRNAMIAKGKEHSGKFSWEKCTKETLEYLKNFA